MEPRGAIERRPTASRRRQCSAAPPPQEGTRERELPLLSKAAVTTEVTTEPDEDVKKKKKVTDSHTHARQTQGELKAEHGVATERDEDVKSLTAAIRLGGSETREERQKAGRGETTERM